MFKEVLNNDILRDIIALYVKFDTVFKFKM